MLIDNVHVDKINGVMYLLVISHNYIEVVKIAYMHRTKYVMHNFALIQVLGVSLLTLKTANKLNEYCCSLRSHTSVAPRQ